MEDRQVHTAQMLEPESWDTVRMASESPQHAAIATEPGVPLVRAGHRWRPFQDGCGKISPGRRLPDSRAPCSLPWIQQTLLNAVVQDVDAQGRDAISRLRAMLLQGDSNQFSSPFSSESVEKCRRSIATQLTPSTTPEAILLVSDGQPFLLQLLHLVAKQGGDKDAEVTKIYSEGVPMGVNEDLPRTPEVFDPREAWNHHICDAEPVEPPFLHKKLLAEDVPFVEEQLAQEVQMGFRTGPYTDAEVVKELGGERPVRGILKIAERQRWVRIGHNKFGPKTERRVVLDLTTPGTNRCIKVMDRIPQPGPPEGRFVLSRSQALGPSSKLSFLKLDYSKCHQRIKKRDQDRKYSVVSPRPDVNFISNVGDFGCASIAYWAGRLLSLVHRTIYMWLGSAGEFWQLLYADDVLLAFRLECFWPTAACVLLWLVVLGAPLSWKKLSAALRMDWIGFLLNGSRFALGITECRQQEMLCGLQALLLKPFVRGRDIEHITHVMVWIANVHEPIRPLLHPLFRFMHGAPRDVSLPMPPLVRVMLAMLVKVIGFKQEFVPPELRPSVSLAAAGDASATDSEIAVGGWFGHRSATPKEVHWCRVVFNKNAHPWAFDGKTPQARVAALELLIPLVLARAMQTECNLGSAAVSISIQSDALGASFSGNKLFSTTMPSAAILYAYAVEAIYGKILPRLHWKPREANRWADDIAGGRVGAFSPSKQVPVDTRFAEIGWFCQMHQEAESLYSSAQAAVKREKHEGVRLVLA